MSFLSDVKEDPRHAFYAMLGDARAGMLGLAGGKQGPQPMTHFADEAGGKIWFVSSRRTDLVTELGTGAEALFVLITSGHDGHVSLRGRLTAVTDRAKLEELWNPVVSAWFDGIDDPDVALLRMDPQIAEIWAARSSALRFGIEIVRANLNPDYEPDVGAHAVVTF